MRNISEWVKISKNNFGWKSFGSSKRSQFSLFSNFYLDRRKQILTLMQRIANLV